MKKIFSLMLFLLVGVFVGGCDNQKEAQIKTLEKEKLNDVTDSRKIEKEIINLGDGWKSYRNYKYGYELQYPEKMIIKDCDHFIGLSFDAYDVNSCGEGTPNLSPIVINYNYFAKPQGGDLSENYLKRQEETFSNNLIEFEMKEVEIGGKKLTSFSGIVKQDADEYFYGEYRNSKFISVIYPLVENSYDFRMFYKKIKKYDSVEKYEDVFNEIIKRFVVLE